jgi:hypothetical protein
MPTLVSPGFQKPPANARLIRGHESTAGLLGYWTLADAAGGGPVNATALLRDLSPQSNPLFAYPPSGHAASEYWQQGSANYGAGVLNGATSPVYISQRTGTGLITAMTFMAAVNLSATQPSFAALLSVSLYGNSSSSAVTLNFNGTALQASFQWNTQFGTAGAVIPANTDTIVAVTFDATTGKWASYSLGQTTVTGTAGGQAGHNISAGSENWALGSDVRFTSGTRTINGTAYWGAAWGRVLPAGEIAALMARPYQMIEPPLTRRVYLFGSAASSGTTVPATVMVQGAGALTVAASLGAGVRALVSGGGAVTVATKVSDAATLSVAGSGRTNAAASASFAVAVTVAGQGRTTATVAVSDRAAVAVAGAGKTTIAPAFAPSIAVAVAGSGKATVAASVSAGVAATVAGSGKTKVSAAESVGVAVTVAGQGHTSVATGNGQTFAIAVSVPGQGQTRLSSGQTQGIAAVIAGQAQTLVRPQQTQGIALSVAGAGQSAVRAGSVAGVRVSVAGQGAVLAGVGLGVPIPPLPVRATLSVAPAYSATLTAVPAFTAQLAVANTE